MSEKFFALGLSEHRVWGLVLQPMMLMKDESDQYFKPDHIIYPSDTDINFTGLTNTEKNIVRIIDECSEQNLFRLFSKNKNLREFQENVKKENLENFIRPYIEKRIAKVFDIIRGTKIKLFIREKSRSNIFDEDFLIVVDTDIQPVFQFSKAEEETSYSLELMNGDKKLAIKDKYHDVISNIPAIIRVSNKVYIVPDIEAKKIRPFFSKEKILIPESSVIQYFKTFAKNIISDYEVNAIGFRIRVIDPKRQIFLSLEKGIRNKAVAILEFSYGKQRIYPNSEKKVFVDFHQNNGEISFDKYSRDDEWEQSYHDLLNDLGLVSFDQVNYEIKGNRDLPLEDQFHELVVWLNKNWAELSESEMIICKNPAGPQFYTGPVELAISSELKNDWFDVYARVICGDYSFPLIRLRKNILGFDREYPLPDGSIFIIPQEWFGRFTELFKFGKADDEAIRVHKQHFFIIEKAEKEISASAYRELEKLNRREELNPATVPASLNATLRPYQAEGFTWLWYLQQNNLGGCLADDMGLGKTLQAITLLLKNMENFKGAPVTGKKTRQPDLFSRHEEKPTSLIVVPASLVHNWINEIHRFAPG
ncbi:MAG: DEAD/DEAH box helicase, partial [Bacteroidales bacterium]|nr:DEAD/DEAH box helicase [Bacteroidales bacterium]